MDQIIDATVDHQRSTVEIRTMFTAEPEEEEVEWT